MPCFSAWLSLPKTRVVTDGATPAAESRGRRLDRLTWRVDALPLRYAASTVYGITPHADIDGVVVAGIQYLGRSLPSTTGALKRASHPVSQNGMTSVGMTAFTVDQRNALALLCTRIAATTAWLFLCMYA
jgi:hypothetical protein